MRYIKEVDEETFTKIVKESNSKSEIARKLGIDFYNGCVTRDVNELLEKYKVSTIHFQSNKQNIKYETLEKLCPVCGKPFMAKIGSPREKQTCSYKCSNTHFRSGLNNGRFLSGSRNYQNVCFLHHGKKCLVCGEEKIVAAHHLDENHTNNDPKNLVPLCPTHHCYIHSGYRKEIQHIIDEYLKKKYNGA